MIQTSLDTLRAAKPDYTPRIGHAWPIVDVPKPKIPGKGHGGTRQASVIPGATEDISLLGSSKQQTADNNKPPEEDEEKQIWEPFAFAFYSTRAEVEKKRAAALAAAASAKSRDPMEPALDNMSKRINVPPAVSDGAPSGSNPLAAGTSKSFTVPTADAPTPNKQKGTPGPPGKPGHGKKKQRRECQYFAAERVANDRATLMRQASRNRHPNKAFRRQFPLLRFDSSTFHHLVTPTSSCMLCTDSSK